MSVAVVIARNSLAELRSRRLVLVALGISTVFAGLFLLGFTMLYGRVEAEAATNPSDAVFVSALMTIMGLYVVHFLTAFLAMFLAVGAVAGPASDGTLLALLARPISRAQWLVGRFLALGLLVVVYPAVMAALLLAVAGAVGGYGALSPWRAAALLSLEGLVLVSMAIFASSRWSTITSGVVVFALFGLAWLAGIIELVGELLANEGMRTVGIVVSLLVPTDVLWRGASYYLQSPAFLALQGVTAGGAGGAEAALPFAGNAPPTAPMLAWAVGYTALLLWLAVRSFSRRDL